ncbi:hypothetical protein KKF34_08400 [Myxococcota bacterium]|nr:hypothetical protein [Myxococcota bacterium]MBU1379733.1 hypothetical protein [Myxococcota bacterium]MBU1496883.1 hypothetical protein [Myxococcota bacterium]
MKNFFLLLLILALVSIIACSKDESKCGNGIVDNNEECDGEKFAPIYSQECTKWGYSGNFFTNLRIGCKNCHLDFTVCEPLGICGDGKLGELEECDGELSDGAACVDFGYYGGGKLGCKSNNCTYDTSLCERCGDGILQPEEGEQCDKKQIGDYECADGGLWGTAPMCSDNCEISYVNCQDRILISGRYAVLRSVELDNEGRIITSGSIGGNLSGFINQDALCAETDWEYYSPLCFDSFASIYKVDDSRFLAASQWGSVELDGAWLIKNAPVGEIDILSAYSGSDYYEGNQEFNSIHTPIYPAFYSFERYDLSLNKLSSITIISESTLDSMPFLKRDGQTLFISGSFYQNFFEAFDLTNGEKIVNFYTNGFYTDAIRYDDNTVLAVHYNPSVSTGGYKSLELFDISNPESDPVEIHRCEVPDIFFITGDFISPKYDTGLKSEITIDASGLITLYCHTETDEFEALLMDIDGNPLGSSPYYGIPLESGGTIRSMTGSRTELDTSVPSVLAGNITFDPDASFILSIRNSLGEITRYRWEYNSSSTDVGGYYIWGDYAYIWGNSWTYYPQYGFIFRWKLPPDPSQTKTTAAKPLAE